MEWLKELLGDDLYSQVTSKLGDTKVLKDDGKMIPKERFDQVNSEKKSYKDQVDTLNQELGKVKGQLGGQEDLQKQIQTLQDNIKAKDDEIVKTRFESKLDIALKEAKVKNTKALKALLEIEGIKLNEDKLEGLEEQLSKIKETDSYLFDVEENPAGTGSQGNFGRKGNEGGTGGASTNDFMSAIFESQVKRD